MSDKSTVEAYIAIDRCPVHGYYAVCVGERNGDGSGHGTRLTPSKCCGRWDEVRSWPLTVADCDSIIYEVEAIKKSIKRRDTRKIKSRGK